jgi:hypothetical protein
MQLKILHATAVEAALERARHYRLLNDPENAESICLDILQAEPGHQKALVQLILSLTDQFDGGTGLIDQARQYLALLGSEYERVYYGGLVCERAARSFLKKGSRDSGSSAWQWLQEAMKLYEQAEELSSRDCEDAMLRWNACVRTIEKRKLKAPDKDNFVHYSD